MVTEALMSGRTYPEVRMNFRCIFLPGVACVVCQMMEDPEVLKVSGIVSIYPHLENVL